MQVQQKNSLIVITVNDIKQYIYCPRIVYFQYVLPVRTKPTFKMEAGQYLQARIESLEMRRCLNRYHLTNGERIFNKQLFSATLGLSGKMDLIIHTDTGYFPVDFKNSNEKVHLNHIMQLGGYALLLEEAYSCKVDQGFIYLIPNNNINKISITEGIKSGVKDIISGIREIIARETMPEQAKFRSHCQDCEFKNYCNDVW